MATCKDCLHYGICVFHLKGDENQKCQHYIDDVVPKSEVERLEKEVDRLSQVVLYHDAFKADEIREIFEEIEISVASKIPMKIKPIFKNDLGFDAGVIDGKQDALFEVLVLIAELKKKYVTDTNVGNKVFSKEIAKLIGDNYTMSRDLKTAVKLIEGWQDEFGKLKDAKIIEGLQSIEAITSVHMLTLEKYKDTNATNKVSSGDICVVCGEHVPEGRQICSMCETAQEFWRKRKGDDVG